MSVAAPKWYVPCSGHSTTTIPSSRGDQSSGGNHAAAAPQGITLNQRLNDLDSLDRAQLVHGISVRERSRIVKRIVVKYYPDR
jgi:hypothetical protein